MDSRVSDRRPVGAAIAAPEGPPLEAMLGAAGGVPRPRRLLRNLTITFALLALVGAIALGVRFWRSPAEPAYATEAVRLGDLVVSVSATGTLQPLNQVDVGSELSGTVDRVLVDDNDIVQRGQVLATLDTARLLDQIALSEASLAQARANLQGTQATAREAELKLGRLQTMWASSQGAFPARADLDAAEAAFDRAGASVAAARASVGQSEASLRTNRTNLQKASIRSPISGVVLTRRVEPGQTVAASLQAPVLFTLAEDLSHMELQVDVDEAEVANVRPGQDARFTVDAYQGRDYPAKVVRIGLGSHINQGVVSYTGVLSVENPDLSLRPGMTASAEIASDSRQGVLLVPAAALRFSPPQADSRSGVMAALTPRMGSAGRGGGRGGGPGRAALEQVWILDDGAPRRLDVRSGASDGRYTEISGAEVRAGMTVIVSARNGG